jgi:hypothetical protein
MNLPKMSPLEEIYHNQKEEFSNLNENLKIVDKNIRNSLKMIMDEFENLSKTRNTESKEYKLLHDYLKNLRFEQNDEKQFTTKISLILQDFAFEIIKYLNLNKIICKFVLYGNYLEIIFQTEECYKTFLLFLEENSNISKVSI